MSPNGEAKPSFLVPVGTITLLLADVEGSVRLWERDRKAMALAGAGLGEIVIDTVGRHGGVRPVEQGEGDSFVAAFSRASDALACAVDLQLAIASGTWPEGLDLRLRLALHTGDAQLRDEGNYIGAAVNRCARLRDIGHGGQVLLSRATHDLVVDRLPEKVTLLDLGSYRLRDLARPEQVYQLCHPELPTGFEPLRSLDALPNNLPTQRTSFIGRETEIAEIQRLLRDARLMTLTGAGGCGKTRLALQIAVDVLDEYPDGVWWVDLARLSDSTLVPNAVLAALSLKEVPGQLLVDTVKNHLLTKRALILLDNCEHVLPACTEMVDDVLRDCPSIAIIATSRETLGVEGEIPWRVPSLTLPDETKPPALEALSQCEAVRLFIDRAVRVRPNFEVTNENAPAVAEICHRLDGIPLAVELAAARTRMMTPEQIAAGLSDRFRLLTGGIRTVMPRNQTLQASVDWSHDLLSPDERILLRRLSVFAGGFTLSAAEEACSGDGIESQAVLELLSHLVDRSLVQVEESGAEVRYRLLETIRQYGRDRLSESGEETAVRTHHLDFYAALAAQAEPELEKAGLYTWLERLDLEHDNLRAAIDWSTHSVQSERSLSLTSDLWLFWCVRGHFAEGRRRFDIALSLDADPALRAKALVGVGQLEIFHGDLPAMRAFGEEALAAGRKADDPRITGRALNILGWAVTFLEPDQAPAILEEGIELSRETGDSWWLADSLNCYGLLNIVAGEMTAAERYLREGLSCSRKTGSPVNLEIGLAFLGWVHAWRGEFSEAKAALEEGLAIARRLEDRVAMTAALYGLVIVTTHRGDYERAEVLSEESFDCSREWSPMGLGFALLCRGLLEYARGDRANTKRYLDEALSFSRDVGIGWITAWSLRILADGARAGGDHDIAASYLDEAHTVARETGGSWALALTREGLGRLTRSQGDNEGAEALHHEALNAFMEMGHTLSAIDTIESLAGLAAAGESFGEAARLLAAAESLREAIGYARFASEHEAHEADLAVVRSGLGAEDFERAWAEGKAMSLAEAVAYAARGRGVRKRPSTGWASLTPTELEVVRLVARGLTNPQVAERLFIARGTVKAHLGHIFSKLGVSTRAELASEVTRRGMKTTPAIPPAKP